VLYLLVFFPMVSLSGPSGHSLYLGYLTVSHLVTELVLSSYVKLNEGWVKKESAELSGGDAPQFPTLATLHDIGDADNTCPNQTL
jgi:hypothetical protein